MPSRKRANGKARKAKTAAEAKAKEAELPGARAGNAQAKAADKCKSKKGQVNDDGRPREDDNPCINLDYDGLLRSMDNHLMWMEGMTDRAWMHKEDPNADGSGKKSKEEKDFEAALMRSKLRDDVGDPPKRPECPLCAYSLPPNPVQSKYLSCCGQVICRACFVRDDDLHGKLMSLKSRELPPMPPDIMSATPPPKDSFMLNFLPGTFEKHCEKLCCPFCRNPDTRPMTKAARENRRRLLEGRAEGGESRALLELGHLCMQGERVTAEEKTDLDRRAIIEGERGTRVGRDPMKALACYAKAANLGEFLGWYALAKVAKMSRKAQDFLAYMEKAAELGCMDAHHELAELALKQGNFEVAMAHFKVLAFSGYNRESLDQLTSGCKEGHVTKDELASALRAFQPARDEYCSIERVQQALVFAAYDPDKKKATPCGQFM